MNLKVISTGSKGNCYLLQQGDDLLMLEAGVKMDDILRAVGYVPAALQGALVSHVHGDHSKSLKRLVEAYVDTYASLDTFTLCNAPMHLPSAHVIEPGHTVAICDWIVHAFSTEHDAPGSLGFYIGHVKSTEKIMFVTDTGYIKVNPAGVTCLLVECNHTDASLEEHMTDIKDRFVRLNQYHMSLERVLSYLDQIDRSKLHTIALMHLSDTNSDEIAMIKAVQERTGCTVIAASNGLSVTLDEIPF